MGFRLWNSGDFNKFFGGSSGSSSSSKSSVPAATSQQPAASSGSMKNAPQWDSKAWQSLLGMLEQRAQGQNLIAPMVGQQQLQGLEQTMLGQLGAGYDPARARTAINAFNTAGANVAGQTAIAGAQEQLGYQQALANALLGQGQLGISAAGQQNQLYMLGQQQQYQAQQNALNRALQQQLQNQQLSFEGARLSLGAMMQQQGYQKLFGALGG